MWSFPLKWGGSVARIDGMIIMIMMWSRSCLKNMSGAVWFKWFVEVLFYLTDNLASWVLWIKCVCRKVRLIWPLRPIKIRDVDLWSSSPVTSNLFWPVHVHIWPPSSFSATLPPFLVSSLFFRPSWCCGCCGWCWELCKCHRASCRSNGLNTFHQLATEKWLRR